MLRYNLTVAYQRTWSDEALQRAIPKSHSWLGVARELGLQSSSVRHGLRRRADQLGLDYSHFTGQRTWSDEDLRKAIAESSSWNEAARRVGISARSSTGARSLRSHAERLGLNVSHFASHEPVELRSALPFTKLRAPAEGSRAGLSIAARWFLSRGYGVSIPLEPEPYDLITDSDEGLKKIQVKTTRMATGNGRYRVRLVRNVYDASATLGNAGGKHRQLPYEQGSIDFFFIIVNGDGKYLIPFEVVAGLKTIILDYKYAAFKIPD